MAVALYTMSPDECQKVSMNIRKHNMNVRKILWRSERFYKCQKASMDVRKHLWMWESIDECKKASISDIYQYQAVAVCFDWLDSFQLVIGPLSNTIAPKVDNHISTVRSCKWTIPHNGSLHAQMQNWPLRRLWSNDVSSESLMTEIERLML